MQRHARFEHVGASPSSARAPPLPDRFPPGHTRLEPTPQVCSGHIESVGRSSDTQPLGARVRLFPSLPTVTLDLLPRSWADKANLAKVRQCAHAARASGRGRRPGAWRGAWRARRGTPRLGVCTATHTCGSPGCTPPLPNRTTNPLPQALGPALWQELSSRVLERAKGYCSATSARAGPSLPLAPLPTLRFDPAARLVSAVGLKAVAAPLAAAARIDREPDGRRRAAALRLLCSVNGWSQSDLEGYLRRVQARR